MRDDLSNLATYPYPGAMLTCSLKIHFEKKFLAAIHKYLHGVRKQAFLTPPIDIFLPGIGQVYRRRLKLVISGIEPALRAS